MKITVIFPHYVHETLKELAHQRDESLDQIVQFCLGFAHFVNETHFAYTFNKGPSHLESLYNDHKIDVEIDSICLEICKSFITKMHNHEGCNHDYSFEEEMKAVIIVSCISYADWSYNEK